MDHPGPGDGRLSPRRERHALPFEPPIRPWKGAAAGAVLGAYTLAAFLAVQLDSPLGSATDLLLTLLAVLLAGGAIGVWTGATLALLQLVHRWWAAALAGAAGSAMLLVWLTHDARTVWLVPFLTLPPALLGGAVGLGLERGFARRGSVLFLAAAVAVNGLAAWWWLWPGPVARFAAPGPAGARTEALALSDPGAPGSHTVKTLTYGSGSDRRRPEYGAGASLRTQPVDLRPLLPDGSDWYRTWYWGFDFAQAPLNGRVWYPAGEGPWPLVLLVHGNHRMHEFSDTGYTYLGEHLASRGYIAVSVDQNFLNRSWTGDLEGRENGARAWLLLKHLEQWQQWNGTVGTPFYRRVDMSNIALAGHSRGGEAAALAAVLAGLPSLPDDASVPLSFRFHIRAVAALAPADGQYRPAGQLPVLQNVSYLVLQGTGDTDVTSFPGLGQYQRARFAEGVEGFKAALTIAGANHSQFNTAWGSRDWSGLSASVLTNRGFLQAEAQQQIARVYLAAFLDVTLRGRREYLPLLQDWRTGAHWLPKTAYASQYAAAGARVVADFEEDVNLLTTTAEGGLVTTENLSVWREGPPGPGWGSAVWVAWPAAPGKLASYTLALPDSLAAAWKVDRSLGLTFTLADARRPGAEPLPPLDLSVEVASGDGIGARLPLSQWATVPVAAPVPALTKLGGAGAALHGSGGVPVPQTYVLPLSAFMDGTSLQPERLRTIRFRFDRTPAGALLIDNVGFTPLP